MYVNSIGMINNSAFNMMQNSNSLMSLTRSAGANPNQDLNALNQSEKKLTASNLQNSLIYNASSLMEDSQKKLEKENIKRSFSTFA